MDVTGTIQGQLKQETATHWATGGGIEPAWLTIPGAVRYSSLSRSKLYQLLDGEVRSVCLRDRNMSRGTRLISRASLENYILRHENIKSEPVPGPKGRKKVEGSS